MNSMYNLPFPNPNTRREMNPRKFNFLLFSIDAAVEILKHILCRKILRCQPKEENRNCLV